MHAWMLMAVLAMPGGVEQASASAPAAASFVTYEQAARDLSPRLKTGSLLFNKGDCLAVRMYTVSPYTHVAAVVIEAGEPVVYDSMNRVGVRRQSLADYLTSQSPDLLHVFHPTRELTAEQGRAFSKYLDSQLGRPYAVSHYLTGRRCKGVHCAEYVTDSLMSIGLLHAERPSKVSPASLVTGITQANIYTADGTIELRPPPRPTPVGENRCHQLWIDTKLCLGKCCGKLSGWFLCR